LSEISEYKNTVVWRFYIFVAHKNDPFSNLNALFKCAVQKIIETSVEFNNEKREE